MQRTGRVKTFFCVLTSGKAVPRWSRKTKTNEYTGVSNIERG